MLFISNSRGLRLFIALTLSLAVGAAYGQRYKPVKEGGSWWLKGPDGKKVFSLGVCVVDPGTSWGEYDTGNPSYAGFRYYPNEDAWAKDAVNRLQSWGFNTVGAWSAYSSLLAVPANKMYMTPIIHMGSSAGFPWLDMWDPALVKVSDDVTKSLLESLKKDPRIIGYFSDNELGWWQGGLFKWIWDQKTHGTRSHAVDVLSLHYGGSWAAFAADFDPEGATSFAELREKGKVYMRPGAKGEPAAQEVLAMMAERYYSLCRDQIKKYDPDALYLGDRYISNYYPEVVEQAGKYCDVVSTNLNPDWNDGGYVRYHLDTLEQLTQRPLMITEYYMTAMENSTGSPNSSSGFPVVQTQEERARGFTNTTEAFLHNPNVVGAHWFQYYDEPAKGRGDGENYDFGLVDVSNKPYDPLTAAVQALNVTGAHTSAKAETVTEDFPPAPTTSLDDVGTWTRNRAFVAANEKAPVGDLYCTWNPSTVLLGVFWHEGRFDEQFYRGDKVPPESRSTVEITIPKTHTRWLMQLTDKGGEVAVGPNWKMDVKSETSSHLVLEIPATAFGVKKLKPWETVEVNVRLISENRAYTTTWHAWRPLGL
jgi:hypothetical protein